MTINLLAMLHRAASVTEGDTRASELAQDVIAVIDELADAQYQIRQLKLLLDQARGEA